MFLFYYSLLNYLRCLRWGQSFKLDYVYKSLKYFWNYSGLDKKSFFRSLWEVERLAFYWRCFPDMYFKMSMFLKDWNEMDIMKTFVPQAALFAIGEKRDKRYNMLIDDKVIFHDLMNYYQIPIPYVFFIYRDKRFLSSNQIEEYTEEQVNSILSHVKENRIFVKRFAGGEASGVSIFTKKSDRFYDGDQVVDGHYIREKCGNDKYFFEQQIHQHEILNELNPDTVNTIRVLASYDDKEGVIIHSATLRVGRKGAYVDNAAQGGVCVPIDLETGKLGEYGVMMYVPEKYMKHPDTYCVFGDKTIPYWDSVNTIVAKALRTLPPFKTVGFDIAITPEEPIITEINTGPGMFLSQAGRKRGLGKEFVS